MNSFSLLFVWPKKVKRVESADCLFVLFLVFLRQNNEEKSSTHVWLAIQFYPDTTGKKWTHALPYSNYSNLLSPTLFSSFVSRGTKIKEKELKENLLI